MIEIVRASARSKAQPSAFFARWIDHETWSNWDTDTEWVRLLGPVAVGTRGVMKPKDGPRTKFFISACTPEHEYPDTTKLFGAKLVFAHWVTRNEEDGDSQPDIAVTIEGPLAFLWTRILGPGFRKSTQPSLDRLIALVEQS